MRNLTITLLFGNYIITNGLYMARNTFLGSAGQYVSQSIWNGPFLNMAESESSEIKTDISNANKETDRTNPLTINFYSPVTTETCMILSNMLKSYDVKSKELEFVYDYRIPIKLHMQSIGGELMPTFYVCDLIQQLDTPVHIYIDGYVASAASIIAVCGDKRFITKHSTILIHQLKSTSSGKLNEMKDEMNNLNFFMGMVKEIYLNNSNISEDELDDLLLSDIWLSAEKCLSLGLVDKII
jgi:ATP-dependent protease ClpP protease subunit